MKSINKVYVSESKIYNQRYIASPTYDWHKSVYEIDDGSFKSAWEDATL